MLSVTRPEPGRGGGVVRSFVNTSDRGSACDPRPPTGASRRQVCQAILMRAGTEARMGERRGAVWSRGGGGRWSVREYQRVRSLRASLGDLLRRVVAIQRGMRCAALESYMPTGYALWAEFGTRDAVCVSQPPYLGVGKHLSFA